MEGSHDGHRKFACGCPPDVYGCPRRGSLGPAPRRAGSKHQSTTRPVPLPPGRVGYLAAADIDRTTGGWRQGKGQQLPAPLAPLLAPAADYPWRPGLTNRGDRLDDGAAYACEPTSLLRASDFTHVALSEATGEPWLSEPISLVEPDGEDEAVQEPGRTIFPYLQLFPPQCQSCRC